MDFLLLILTLALNGLLWLLVYGWPYIIVIIVFFWLINSINNANCPKYYQAEHRRRYVRKTILPNEDIYIEHKFLEGGFLGSIKLTKEECFYIQGLRAGRDSDALKVSINITQEEIENLYNKFGLVDTSKNRDAQLATIMCMNGY